MAIPQDPRRDGGGDPQDAPVARRLAGSSPHFSHGVADDRPAARNPVTLARTWRAHIQEDRIEDYLTFLEERSVPMFRSLPGCLGAVFLRDRDVVTVVSIWTSGTAIDALPSNALYTETVAALESSGILVAADRATVHDCDGFIAHVMP